MLRLSRSSGCPRNLEINAKIKATPNAPFAAQQRQTGYTSRLAYRSEEGMRTLLLGALLLMLAACGQKGALYSPNKSSSSDTDSHTLHSGQ